MSLAGPIPCLPNPDQATGRGGGRRLQPARVSGNGTGTVPHDMLAAAAAAHRARSGSEQWEREVGWIYTLHFQRPYRHALHYTGFAVDLDVRLAQHADGTGANLLKVILAAGIGWQVASVERGTRRRERQLKQRGASRRCRICRAERHRLALQTLVGPPATASDVLATIELGYEPGAGWGLADRPSSWAQPSTNGARQRPSVAQPPRTHRSTS